MTNEERERFEAALRERRQDLVRNPEGVRKVIHWFDGQIEGIASKVKEDPEKYGGDYLERHTRDFMTNRNNLSDYIGDPKKTFNDFISPAHKRS